MTHLSRKEFLELAGMGLGALLLPACLASCKKSNTSSAAQNTQTVDFTISVASGSLSKNGGYLLQNGVIVARTNSGTFIAVSSSCTHQGGTIEYTASSNSFYCPNHGAGFDASGNVTNGPATISLQKFNTTLTGTNLRVYS
jgi:cytochrome b6-f complex iron-sulfur subunit